MLLWCISNAEILLKILKATLNHVNNKNFSNRLSSQVFIK